MKKKAKCQQKTAELNKHLILSCLGPSYVLIDDVSWLFVMSKSGNSEWWSGEAGPETLWESHSDVQRHTHFEVFSHLMLELCLLVSPTIFHILWNLFHPSAPWPHFNLPPSHTYTHTHTFCWQVEKMTLGDMTEILQRVSSGFAHITPRHHSDNTQGYVKHFLHCLLLDINTTTTERYTLIYGKYCLYVLLLAPSCMHSLWIFVVS